MRSPLARERRHPAGFIKPCQPTLSDKAPSGPLRVHEIKHDGYRIIACKSGETVRLWSRNGRDWSKEFLAGTDALLALKPQDIVLHGEAMVHCKNGLPDFFGLRSEDGGARACLFAFDLLRLDGEEFAPVHQLFHQIPLGASGVESQLVELATARLFGAQRPNSKRAPLLVKVASDTSGPDF